MDIKLYIYILVEMNTLFCVVADAINWIVARLVFDHFDALAFLALLVAMTGNHVQLSSFILFFLNQTENKL